MLSLWGCARGELKPRKKQSLNRAPQACSNSSKVSPEYVPPSFVSAAPCSAITLLPWHKAASQGQAGPHSQIHGTPGRICRSRTPSRHQFLPLSAKELSLPWKVKFVTRKENFTIVCLNNLGSRIFSQVLFPNKAKVSIILFSEITIYYPCRQP